MSITNGQIKALARLSKLEFSEEEEREFIPEFEKMLGFADTINAQIEGDKATFKQATEETVGYEELRDDEVEQSLPQEKITGNVRSQNGYFAVKRVVK